MLCPMTWRPTLTLAHVHRSSSPLAAASCRGVLPPQRHGQEQCQSIPLVWKWLQSLCDEGECDGRHHDTPVGRRWSEMARMVRSSHERASSGCNMNWRISRGHYDRQGPNLPTETRASLR
jgi:hypothetical protein